jgi:hypothetical protein
MGAGSCGLDNLVNVFEEGSPRCEGVEIRSRICAWTRVGTTAMETRRVKLCLSVIVKREIREARLHCAGSEQRKYQRRRDGGAE